MVELFDKFAPRSASLRTPVPFMSELFRGRRDGHGHYISQDTIRDEDEGADVTLLDILPALGGRTTWNHLEPDGRA
jgi:hypothetical protein